MLLVERINTDQLHSMTIFSLDLNFLYAGTNQPYRNLFTSHDLLLDVILLGCCQLQRCFIRNVAVSDQFAILIQDICAIFSQTANDIHAGTKIQHGIDIGIGQLRSLTIDACPDSDFLELFGKICHVLLTQNSTGIQLCFLAAAIQVNGQDSAYQCVLPFCAHHSSHRMRESMGERQSTAVDALVDLITQLIACFLVNQLVLRPQQCTIGTDQIFNKLMTFHTVQNVQLLSDLVASCLGQIIAAVIKELGIHQVQ